MVILHDIQSGDLHLAPGKTIYDYITEYQFNELHKQILILVEATGVNISQLERIIKRNITEQTLNEFNQFDNLKLTLNMPKTRDFIVKIEGVEVPARMVMPKIDKILREFILDGGCRERILKAYLNEDEKYSTDTAYQESSSEQPSMVLDNPQETEKDQSFDIDIVKTKVKDILITTLNGILPQMRPIEEVLNSVFYVIGKESIESLDNVGLFINRAFTNLYRKKVTIVDKFVAFNLLVTKYEAYLKKLYYLIHNNDVPTQNEGEDVNMEKCNLCSQVSFWNFEISTDTISNNYINIYAN